LAGSQHNTFLKLESLIWSRAALLKVSNFFLHLLKLGISLDVLVRISEFCLQFVLVDLDLASKRIGLLLLLYAERCLAFFFLSSFLLSFAVEPGSAFSLSSFMRETHSTTWGSLFC